MRAACLGTVEEEGRELTDGVMDASGHRRAIEQANRDGAVAHTILRTGAMGGGGGQPRRRRGVGAPVARRAVTSCSCPGRHHLCVARESHVVH